VSRANAVQWAQQMLRRDFVVLDTETTGFGAKDELVSIAIIDQNLNILLHTLLQHTKQSDPSAQAAHGLSYVQTRTAPMFAEVWPRIVQITTGRSVVIYNRAFDLRLIGQTVRRYNLGLDLNIHQAYCAMEAFAEFYGERGRRDSYRWKKLEVAAKMFKIPTEGAHNALIDAKTTLLVIQAMAAWTGPGPGAPLAHPHDSRPDRKQKPRRGRRR